VNKRLRIGVAGLGIAFVLAIVLGVTGVLAPKNQRVALGASTTLTIISGQILVRHGAGDFAPADDGAVLSAGDTVRTGADARGVLTYFEGSTVEIEPNAELTIETAHGNPDGSTVIVMRQEIGSTWHVVTHLVQGGSKYEVKTTSSTASVRGTEFQVGVAEDLATTVTTTEGNVATSDPGSTKVVEVTQGLQTTTKKGELPEAPKPAPEPGRKVTVTVADPNALVLDSLGRANGVKDGKVIVQTPGAQVKVVGGQLVVTLPNVPDGTIATHFANTSAPDRDVDVSTKVEEKGKAAVEVKDTVRTTAAGPTVTGVDVKKSTTDETPKLEIKTPPPEAKQPKVGQAPPTPSSEDEKKAIDQNSKETGGAAGPTGASANTAENGKGGTTTPIIGSTTTTTTTTTTNTTNTTNANNTRETTGSTTNGSNITNTTPTNNTTSNEDKSADEKSKETEKKQTEQPHLPTGFIPGIRIGPLPVAPTGEQGDDQKKSDDNKGDDTKKDDNKKPVELKPQPPVELKPQPPVMPPQRPVVPPQPPVVPPQAPVAPNPDVKPKSDDNKDDQKKDDSNKGSDSGGKTSPGSNLGNNPNPNPGNNSTGGGGSGGQGGPSGGNSGSNGTNSSGSGGGFIPQLPNITTPVHQPEPPQPPRRATPKPPTPPKPDHNNDDNGN
jgi:hypothetical protein